MARPVKYSDRMVTLEAELVVIVGYTYREVAERMGIPQSTVAQHMKYRLKEINPSLYNQVAEIASSRTK